MDRHDVLLAFQASVARTPDECAVRCPDRTLTYAALDAESNAIAAALVGRGAAAGERPLVAVLLERRDEVVSAILGALKARCGFVPLDPHGSAARLEEAVRGVPLAAVLTSGTLGTTLASVLEAPIPWLDVADLRTRPLHAWDGAASLPAWGPDDRCYLYMTSGSTGKPKRIAGRYRAIGHFVAWEIAALGCDVGTRVTQLTAPTFDAYLRDVFVPLGCSGTICIPPFTAQAMDSAAVADWLARERINVLHCVPSFWRALMSGDLSPWHFDDLRDILLAGEQLFGADVARWLSMQPERIQLVNLYGPTETTMTKCVYRITKEDARRKWIPVGQAMPGAECLVLNSGGSPCAGGEVGEVYLRTEYRSLGYFDDPELTARVFIANPMTGQADDIVYRTGDIGRVLPDGNIELLGRRDRQVKIAGARVELDDVEGCIYEYPTIVEAAVTDEADGAGGKYLCGFVVLKPGVDVEGLRQYLVERLPAWSVPHRLLPLPALPKLTNGKVDRQALTTLARRHDGESRRQPRTRMEAELAGVFAAVLKQSADGIDLNKSFFELGGHSLLATVLLGRIRARYGVVVSFKTFLDRPTIEAVARVIEDAVVANASSGQVASALNLVDGAKP